MKRRLDTRFLLGSPVIGVLGRGFVAFRTRYRASERRFVRVQGAICPRRHEFASHHVQIGQREYREGARCVLDDAAIADLGKAPQALNDMERVFTARPRSRTRARGEHAFHVVKCLWGFAKVRYRGIVKNAARAFAIFALANLYMVRRKLMPPRANCALYSNKPPLGRSISS